MIELVPITNLGAPAAIEDLPPVAQEVISATIQMYLAGGYEPPWIGYLALEAGRCVGTCAFKTPPSDQSVEIAYFTFPGHEGRGVASRMASALIEVARAARPGLAIVAQTLPEENASNRVLKRLGFTFSGEMNHPADGRVWEWRLKE